MAESKGRKSTPAISNNMPNTVVTRSAEPQVQDGRLVFDDRDVNPGVVNNK